MIIDSLTDKTKNVKIDGYSNIINYLVSGSTGITQNHITNRVFWICSNFDVIFLF